MRRILTLAVIIGALAVPGAAFASGSSTCQSYNAQLCTVVGSGSANTSPTVQASTTSTSASSTGTLPFTGLDVGLLVVGGGVLLGAGLIVRRFTRETE
jgi:hypothetical protein